MLGSRSSLHECLISRTQEAIDKKEPQCDYQGFRENLPICVKSEADGCPHFAPNELGKLDSGDCMFVELDVKKVRVEVYHLSPEV